SSSPHQGEGSSPGGDGTPLSPAGQQQQQQQQQQHPGMWPSHTQPMFSLANVLSLAMSVAQSYMPPTSMAQGMPSLAGFHPHMAPHTDFHSMYGQQAPVMGGGLAGPYPDLYRYPGHPCTLLAQASPAPPLMPVAAGTGPPPSYRPGCQGFLPPSFTVLSQDRGDSSSASSSSAPVSPQSTVSSPSPRALSPPREPEASIVASKDRLAAINEEKKPTVTVGRFQVTPTQDIPAAVPGSATCPPPAPAATNGSPPQGSDTESSTEEQGESETSFSTITVSPPQQDFGALGPRGRAWKRRGGATTDSRRGTRSPGFGTAARGAPR
ncbi:hypothetical protein AAFF_G00341010, partial [Aldrovandia affinis]